MKALYVVMDSIEEITVDQAEYYQVSSRQHYLHRPYGHTGHLVSMWARRDGFIPPKEWDKVYIPVN
jgi:hypothetical protein